MQRRTWLKLGLTSTAVLLVAGGVATLIDPGWRDGRLTTSGQRVFGALGAALLEGSLPDSGVARQQALQGLTERIEVLIGGLPAHAQAELSQLLALLGTTAGRLGLMDLGSDWPEASVTQVRAALQGLRGSSFELKQQAYHALREVVNGAYFSAPDTWVALGYPGPGGI